MIEKVNFEFYNTVAPRYLEPLFLKIEIGKWYSTAQLINLLQSEMRVGGKDIVLRNMDAWAGAGIGRILQKKDGRSNKKYFQMAPLGRYLQQTYSTNRDLFFDVIHFLFYSTWPRSRDTRRARFWVYTQVCNDLWSSAPSKMDGFRLTSKIQSLALDTFPGYFPSLSERSVSSIFLWLNALTPPFLEKPEGKSKYSSSRRSYCTPQLFHLAVELTYTNRQIKHGTSLNIDTEIISEVCMVCLLDPDRFWEMAERTQMIVKGFEINKSQWGPTILLSNAPGWIELPTLPNQEDALSDEELSYGNS
jgi:hypothetical protein